MGPDDAAVADAAVAAEIAGRFGLGGSAVLSEPVASGRVGQVCRLDTDRGSWAVKETFGPLDGEAVEWQTQLQDLARAAGARTPHVVRAADGAVSAEVGGRVVRVHEWVDLQPLDRRVDPGAVGRLLATLHRVDLPVDVPVHPWYVETVPVAEWERTTDQLERAGAPFTARLAALLPDLAEVAELVEPPRATQACHRDLFADNVLRATDGGLCVIDWDNAGPADPGGELALALLEYGCQERSRTQGAYASYISGGGPARVGGLADFSMAICVLTHITAEGCRRWLAATTEEEREDNAAWVAEYLDEPLTVPGLQTVLSWLET